MNNPGSTTQAHPAQIELARIFTSVRLFGPPMSEELIELVCHLFSPEEADLARHLPFYLPGSLEKIARRARRNVQDIQDPLVGILRDLNIRRLREGYSFI